MKLKINKNLLKILILPLTLAVMYTSAVFAEENVSVTESVPQTKVEYGKVQYNAKEFKANLDSLDNKFQNLNVNTVYDDLSRMIYDCEDNDYYLMILADKATSLGFFDLASDAFSKISDYEISKIDSENTQRLFFPKYKLTSEDVVKLSEAYSNIEYNDRSEEAIKDIQTKVGNLAENDYANYLISLGYTKLSDFDKANKFIQDAISLNSNNLNYKILQSQIIAETKKFPSDIIR